MMSVRLSVRASAEDSLAHDERVLVRARLGRRIFAAVLPKEHLTAVAA